MQDIFLPVLAFYGPLIYTAPYVMFFMRANPLQGPLEGFGPKKVKTFMAQPFQWPE